MLSLFKPKILTKIDSCASFSLVLTKNLWAKEEIMLIERTLVIIKPHAIKIPNILATALQTYTCQGKLQVTMVRTIVMTKLQAENFYKDLVDRPFFEELIMASTMGQCIVIILEGGDAIKKVRDIHGPTDPRKCAPHHLRHMFGEPWGGPRNAFHGSDSPESFARECNILNLK